jgi:hypothetical protein
MIVQNITNCPSVNRNILVQITDDQRIMIIYKILYIPVCNKFFNAQYNDCTGHYCLFYFSILPWTENIYYLEWKLKDGRYP